MGVPLAELGDESVPQAAPVQPVPDNVQLTLGVAEGSFVTVAVKFWVVFTTTVAEFGETETVMAGTAIVVDADLVGSAVDLAVIVTVKLLAGGPGAVYVVGFEVLLLNVPQLATPQVRIHVTF